MATRVRVSVMRLPHGQHIKLPCQATSGSAGLDLMAALEAPITLGIGKRVLVPTGFAMALPENYEAQLRSRSGLAWRHGVIVLNSPATIDADYRGEVKVILYNSGEEDFAIEPGMRVAQMVIAHVPPITMHEVTSLEEDTERGAGGFGSTGLMPS